MVVRSVLVRASTQQHSADKRSSSFARMGKQAIRIAFDFPQQSRANIRTDPVESNGGYVWSGNFSPEEFGFYELRPAHTYVSSDMARTELAMRLILNGQAMFVGMVPLDNAYTPRQRPR